VTASQTAVSVKTVPVIATATTSSGATEKIV
jgi:hypothetical protein